VNPPGTRASPDEYLPWGAATGAAEGRARTLRRATSGSSRSAGFTIRCSIRVGLTPFPARPLTVSRSPFTAEPVTATSCTVVSALVLPKPTVTTSPARMSGVTGSPPPAPQQTPPGALTTTLGLPPAVVAGRAPGTVADPMTVGRGAPAR